MGPQPHTYRGR
eukprot:gene21420-biopygen2655